MSFAALLVSLFGLANAFLRKVPATAIWEAHSAEDHPSETDKSRPERERDRYECDLE